MDNFNDGSEYLEHSIKNLTESVRNTYEYKRYIENLSILKSKPELYARVCEFRRRNYELQNSDVDSNLYDSVMRFRTENAELRKDALVNDFLQSELGVCRMLQNICNEIMDNVDIDIDFLN